MLSVTLVRSLAPGIKIRMTIIYLIVLAKIGQRDWSINTPEKEFGNTGLDGTITKTAMLTHDIRGYSGIDFAVAGLSPQHVHRVEENEASRRRETK
jgi:hypothetical protein